MAERKRRPPSGKIKPGTPHPTKAHTVRGFDGRWVTRKSYNAAKKAREVAKKGGSLVKRVTSAVTKSSKGDLLKIKKGDKGIVRAIKDTYKFGKDTRRSANAVYKAGKVTRKVHDQLVKGGKEFVKGTREAGKATRRAYERLKPGGKIVKTKGSKITKYKKPASKIVRSPGGKVVKSPGGKLAKSTPNKGGKLVRTSNAKSNTTKSKKFDYSKLPDKFNKTNKEKLKTKKSTPMSRLNKIGNQVGNLKRNIEARTWLDSNKKGKDNLSKKQRATLNNTKLKGNKSGVIASIADAASRPIIDRGMHFLYNKVTGKKTKFKDHQSAMAALKDPKKPWFVKSKPKAKSTTTTAKKPLKTWKNPYKGPKQPEISTGPYKGGAKTENIGTYKGGATVEPLSKKKVTKKTTTNKTDYWQSPRQKQEPEKKAAPKKKEAPKKKSRFSGLKPGMSKRQVESQLRRYKFKGHKKASDRMKIQRLKKRLQGFGDN